MFGATRKCGKKPKFGKISKKSKKSKNQKKHFWTPEQPRRPFYTCLTVFSLKMDAEKVHFGNSTLLAQNVKKTRFGQKIRNSPISPKFETGEHRHYF